MLELLVFTLEPELSLLAPFVGSFVSVEPLLALFSVDVFTLPPLLTLLFELLDGSLVAVDPLAALTSLVTLLFITELELSFTTLPELLFVVGVFSEVLLAVEALFTVLLALVVLTGALLVEDELFPLLF